MAPEEQQIPYGERLLVTVIEARAAANHERPLASIPISDHAADGYRDISYAVFANAINRCAAWLLQRLGPPVHVDDAGKDPGLQNVVPYLASSDLRFQILSVAAVKAGYVMFYPSPRNSRDAFSALFEQAGTRVIIADENFPSPALQVARERGMTRISPPRLNDLLDPQPVPNLPFAGDFHSYRGRAFILLHTSGSTGIPKLVPIKHGMVSTIDAYHLLDYNETLHRYGGCRTFVPAPPFHLSGFFFSLPSMVWVDSTVVLPPAGPLTADLVDACLTASRAQYAALPPSIVSDLTKNPTYLSNLGNLRGLTFSGGPLSVEVAGLVSQRTTLGSSLGATEYGGIPMLPKDPEDWAYFRFNDENAGLEFRETERPGIFEMVFVRHRRLDLLQGIFVTFPELQEYNTRDCFTKHPSKDNLWKYEGRLDDVIVFSNGEKINPVSMEGAITSCPAVNGCLYVGQGRFHGILIIEPVKPDTPNQQLLDELWPFVERANQSVPNQGKIVPECVFTTKPGMPFPRAAKGTIQRSRANELYRDEIEKMYKTVGDIAIGGAAFSADLTSIDTTTEFLTSYLIDELGLEKIGLDADIFLLGMDSLQVMRLVRIINQSQRQSGMGRAELDQRHVYDNPTVRQLAGVVHAGDGRGDYFDMDDEDDYEKAALLSMEKMFTEIVDGLPLDSKKGGRSPVELIKSSATPPLFQPDGGFKAWLQVFACFLININNWGLINSFGVYQTAYENGYLKGNHSPSDISWIGTLQGSLLLIVGVLSGVLFDKGYFRFILSVASLGVVFGLMMLSLADRYWQVILCQGVFIGINLGLLYVPSVAVIPLYFKKKRGLALGIATSGGSIGGVLYPVIFRRVSEEVSVAWATRIIGFVALATLLLANILIDSIGPRASRKLFDISAARDLPFLSFMVAAFFLFAGVLVPYFVAPAFATQDVAASPSLSLYTLAILNAAQFFGRIIPGALSDHFGGEVMLLAAELAAGVLAFCWIAVHSLAGYIVWLAVYGFVSGLTATLPAVVLPWVCPSLAVIGTRLGMIYAAAGVGILISTPVATAISTDTGNFVVVQVWVGACCCAAAGFIAFTCLEAWRARRLYGSRRLRRRR